MEKEQELKEEVRVILTSLEKINQDEVTKEDGLLDFDKLKANKEVREAIKKLDELDIDRKYLMKHFNIAGFILGHLLKSKA